MNNLKKDILNLKEYLFKKENLKNDLILNSYLNKIFDDLNVETTVEVVSTEYNLNDDFKNLDENIYNLILKDLSLFKKLNKCDFNTVVYHRFIVQYAHNYLQSGLDNYILEEDNENFHIKIYGYRMEIELKKCVNLNWSVNKLKSYFKSYYKNNTPKNLITQISINDNELQLM